MIFCLAAEGKVLTFVGSTPAHATVRKFLQISSTDSIDFIRWKLDVGESTFTLDCRYGMSKAGTQGFSNEQHVAFEGSITEAGNYYYLKHNGSSLTLLKVNANVLHFVNATNSLLVGNGGYSYALNSLQPVETKECNVWSTQIPGKGPLMYEGRTPCQVLSTLLGLKKQSDCFKLKWLFTFYTDSISERPSHFTLKGTLYRTQRIVEGKWQVAKSKNGGVTFRVFFDEWPHSLDLLKGDDNVLFFTDTSGEVLVGNEDFSYTLNRRSANAAKMKN